LAKDALDTAIKAWNDEKDHPTPNPARDSSGASVPGGSSGSGVLAASQGATTGARAGGNGHDRSGNRTKHAANGVEAPPPDAFGRGDFEVGQVWTAALELTIATHGAEPYESRLRELFPQMITLKQMERHGWTAVRALPYLDASAKDQLREAVKTYMATEGKQLDATPFGVPPSLRTWGGSGAVVDMAIRMYFLHKAFPDLVSPEYTLRAVNYILGTHPVSSTSYVAGVGTVSKLKTYSNNRADNAYIPGAVIPGYIIIKPDFPECIDDFGFLWFEDEAVVAGSASWVVAGNAAAALAAAQ
jgi:endoglucanase